MKHLAYTLCVLLLLAGCADDSAVNESDSSFLPEGAIGFSGGALTRGTPITNAGNILSMGVFCGLTESSFTDTDSPSNYMNNVHVHRASSSESFTYSPLKYWPMDTSKKLSFFAYAPYADANNGITFTNSSAGTPTLTYAVPTNVIYQPDLMVATPKKDLTKSAGSIQFAMQHALTPVGFKLKGQGEVVTAIKIKGVSTSGTLSMDGSGTISWTGLSDPSTTTVFTAGIPNSNTATSTLTSIMNGNGYLMMIPQALTSAAKLIVTVGGTDKEMALTGTWNAGEQMTYNVSFSNSGGGSVVIGDLTWATGNLVANGTGGCKIGAPEDGGLYFQFGSLVGWSGGATGDGTGRGTSTSNPSPTPALSVRVNDTGSEPDAGSIDWVATAGVTYYDGSGTVPLIPSGAVGDPCRHYLGDTWRLPTLVEFQALFNNVPNGTVWDSVANWGVTGLFTVGSTGSYAKRSVAPYLQFPASGFRTSDYGKLYNVGLDGSHWSATAHGYYMVVTSGYVSPSYSNNRSYGFSVRCVK